MTLQPRFLLFAGLSCLLLFGRAWAAAPPPPPPWEDPPKGVLLGGIAISSAGGELATVWYQPLKVAAPPRCVLVAVPSNMPEHRWQVAHGAFWYSMGFSTLPLLGMPTRISVVHAEFHDLLGQGKESGENLNIKDGRGKVFSNADALGDTYLMGKLLAYNDEVHYDWAPAGPSMAGVFILTNVAGNPPTRVKTSSKSPLEVMRLPLRGPDQPEWSFTYHTIRSRQEAKGGPWKSDAAWKVEATLDVRFFEPFQWFAQGDDWYFVTRSGKLYRAPKPAKGTHRKIDLVWADPDRPVRLFLTDADAGRTFLFIGPGASGKPAFFEAAEKAKLVEHDPIRVPDGKGPEHLRKVLAYAAVLQKRGLVKTK